MHSLYTSYTYYKKRGAIEQTNENRRKIEQCHFNDSVVFKKFRTWKYIFFYSNNPSRIHVVYIVFALHKKKKEKKCSKVFFIYLRNPNNFSEAGQRKTLN